MAPEHREPDSSRHQHHADQPEQFEHGGAALQRQRLVRDDDHHREGERQGGPA